ncbi:MAG: nucleotidyltransferase domain-containing protein [Pseudomonadota bacterium]
MGRPLKGEERRVRVSFTLPPLQARWLGKESQRRGVSRSDLLSTILGLSEIDHAGFGPEAVRKNLVLSRSALAEFCRRHAIRKLALFGSVLRSDFRPDSDVDVLVAFRKGEEPGIFAMSGMATELSGLLGGRKVDLKTPSELSRYFRNEVAREAFELYAA